jgi:CBS domain-containing protein
MVADRIHRLVVLENGRLAGVISSFDIMRAVAEGRL